VLSTPSVPYTTVYLLEVVVLFATLVALGPLAVRRVKPRDRGEPSRRFGLADIPA